MKNNAPCREVYWMFIHVVELEGLLSQHPHSSIPWGYITVLRNKCVTRAVPCKWTDDPANGWE